MTVENSKIEPDAFSIAGLLDYLPNSIVIKTIIRRTTGSISALAFDIGEVMTGKILPYATFIQVIDGRAEIVIDYKSNLLETGQSIIIPANSRNTIKAHVRFKILSTVIKSGYEEVI